MNYLALAINSTGETLKIFQLRKSARMRAFSKLKNCQCFTVEFVATALGDGGVGSADLRNVNMMGSLGWSGGWYILYLNTKNQDFNN